MVLKKRLKLAFITITAKSQYHQPTFLNFPLWADGRKLGFQESFSIKSRCARLIQRMRLSCQGAVPSWDNYWDRPESIQGGLWGLLDVSYCLTQFPPDIGLPFLETQLYLVHSWATVVSWETLWSNKSLFTKPSSGPDLTCGLQFVDPQIKHECLSPPQRTLLF